MHIVWTYNYEQLPMGEKMKKISMLLLCALIAYPAFANDYDEYDTYDDEMYSTCSCDSSDKYGKNRETYAGFRIHRNEHIVYHYEIEGGPDAKIRDNNFGIGLNIGNRLTDNVRIEFETMYTGESDNKKSTDFSYDIWSNMMNVYIYKNYGDAVEPYVGMGLGFGGIWSNINGALGNSKDSEFNMSFALMTGVNFSLNKYVDLNVGVRYVDYGDVKHKNATTHVDATEIFIGAAYKFNIFK